MRERGGRERKKGYRKWKGRGWEGVCGGEMKERRK